MSDMSQDFCVLCGDLVPGVFSGPKGCKIVYISFNDDTGTTELGVCKNCIDALNEAREELENSGKCQALESAWKKASLDEKRQFIRRHEIELGCMPAIEDDY